MYIDLFYFHIFPQPFLSAKMAAAARIEEYYRMCEGLPKTYCCVQCHSRYGDMPLGSKYLMRRSDKPPDIVDGIHIINIFCSSQCYEAHMVALGCPWRQVPTPCAWCLPLTERPVDNGAFNFCSEKHMAAFNEVFPRLAGNPMAVHSGGAQLAAAPPRPRTDRRGLGCA